MTELEKKETERTANLLAEAIHSVNKLNKEQTEYLDLLFKKLFIEQDLEKIQKNIKHSTRKKDK